MNKKILLCGAIAASLFLVACAKKDSPNPENAAPTETEQTVTPNQPTSSEAVEMQASSAEVAEVETVVVPETQAPTAPPKPATPVQNITPPAPPKPTQPVESTPAPVAEAAVAEDKPSYVAPPNKAEAQSQDDAVAAALAAAQPAIEN